MLSALEITLALRGTEEVVGQTLNFVGDSRSADQRQQAKVARRNACNQCPTSGACDGLEDDQSRTFRGIIDAAKSGSDLGHNMLDKSLRGLINGAR